MAQEDNMGSEGLGGNPRYANYARVHGNTPEQQFEIDCKEYPGGKMCGFICWNTRKWSQWRKLRGYVADVPLSLKDHTDYDEWLKGQTE